MYDADRAVHTLYAKGGGAVDAVAAVFSGGCVRDGAVDRAALGAVVMGDTDKLKRLEAIVHPMVRDAQTDFVRKQHAAGAPIVVLDIPLLYETNR